LLLAVLAVVHNAVAAAAQAVCEVQSRQLVVAVR
jgi:hypothetical protein